MQPHSVPTYFRELDSWHTQLAILQNAFHAVFNCECFMEEDSQFGDTLNVLDNRFQQLLDSCPFPDVPSSSKRICTPCGVSYE
ncbi:hypothetical protein [uncultured Thiothrix sp.]|jgi:hypothetical protein|uniref:hypothetical protein n=1 Tax=uncultured Thiothrix sp. TaxID=223185 RepID=UPI0026311044|nr:hypothetical protein [uncultured Thiothrix sp.]